MGQNNNIPVVVTGDERKHPEVRQLARACIALARLRMAKLVAKPSTPVKPSVIAAAEDERHA